MKWVSQLRPSVTSLFHSLCLLEWPFAQPWSGIPFPVLSKQANRSPTAGSRALQNTPSRLLLGTGGHGALVLYGLSSAVSPNAQGGSWRAGWRWALPGPAGAAGRSSLRWDSGSRVASFLRRGCSASAQLCMVRLGPPVDSARILAFILRCLLWVRRWQENM